MPLVPDQIPYLAPLRLPVVVAAVLHQTQTAMAAMAVLVAERLAQPRILEEQATHQALAQHKAQMAATVVALRDMVQEAAVALRQRAAMALAQRAEMVALAQHLASLAHL